MSKCQIIINSNVKNKINNFIKIYMRIEDGVPFPDKSGASEIVKKEIFNLPSWI